MTKIAENKKWGLLLLVFLAALLPRVVLIALYGFPFRTALDEFSTISAAAYGGGLDWTAMNTYSGNYYGGGFTILFSPLFRLGMDSVLIYKVMLLTCAVLQALAAPISFHLMEHYLKIRNKGILFAASLGLSYVVAIRAMMVYNEHMLIFMVWLAIWLMFRLVSGKGGKKGQILGTVLLFLDFSYCLTLHTRAKVLFIAFILLAFLYLAVYRKLFFSPLAAILTGGCGYVLAEAFVKLMKTNIWLWEPGSYLKNASVALDITRETLLSPISWKSWLSIVMGQVQTSMVFTGGFSAIAIVLVVRYLFLNGRKLLVQKAVFPTEEKDAGLQQPYLIVLGLFSVLCIGGMIFAQSFTWLSKVNDGMTAYTFGQNYYGYKAFTYLRYYGLCLGPFLMAGIALVYHCRDLVKEHTIAILLTFGIFQVFFLCFLLPHLSHTELTSNLYRPYALALHGTARTRIYLCGVAACSLFFLLMLILLRMKKTLAPLILLSAVLLYQYCFQGYLDAQKMKYYKTRTDGGYEWMTTMKEEGLELPESIYGVQKGVYRQSTLFVYQFLFQDVEVIPEMPDASLDEALVLCNQNDYQPLLKAGYEKITLDENEYLYLKGEKNRELLASAGYLLQAKSGRR